MIECDHVCQLGVTVQEQRAILGDRFEEFGRWMWGQTMAICDARLYNDATEEYEAGECSEPHGVVVYRDDLQRFLDGLPIID